ncbi:MAG TPA: glucoamylase family protein [Vicinamibacteria bacterium]
MEREPRSEDEDLLDRLQRETFEYFLREANPANGLVADKTREDWPASIAATGLALAAYPVGVERGFLTRDAAVAITLTTLRFFRGSVQSTAPEATGYKGFYYHFLDMTTGRRAFRCELSTVDSAFLLAGALTAASYFDGDSPEERQIRTLADELFRRADWRWAQHGAATVTHGYKPRSGFLKHRWRGYDEALLLYVLGLGSPTYPLPDESYPAWLSTYDWRKIYEYEFVYAGPLFIHQLSHIWIDFRGIQDAYMRERALDYFENSRRATYVQREYAIRNPRGFASYGKDCWGITASDGPGPATLNIDGVPRRFHDYLARGAPHGPDDGTIAPWAVVASLPFAPEIVVPAIRYFVDSVHLEKPHDYGFKATFNPTFPPSGSHLEFGWVSRWNFGLNQGPIVLMIENQRSGLIWSLMRRCPYIVEGLRRAGFRGGWL